ncbi:MAG: fibronectin type III domain-containing protein, partial [Thermoanaerobaculaceae bacterium]|nr:fibronectin type III domain-containing protein [Thermoanaerobaculaceae bacterium]
MFGKTKGFWARNWFTLKVMLIFLTVFYLPTLAQKIKEPQHPLDFYSFSKEELNLTMQGKDYRTLGAELSVAMLSDIEKLKADSGSDQMLVMIDKLTGKPSLIEGGIPWIPGTGIRNKIQPEDIGVSAKQAMENAIPIEKVDQIAKDFLKKYPNLFNINPDELELAKEASGPMLDYLYNVNYRWTYNGLPVENAWLNFHLNSGNLSLFGATYICDTIKKLDTTPTISLNTAWQVVLSYINDQIGFEDEILEPGMLIIQPVLSSSALNGSYYEMGTGMEYRLVYVMIFRKNGVIGDWEARVDAHTGELLFFGDTAKYGHIQGGVYKTDKNPTQTEVIAPFPYANYNGTTSFADINGDFSGTAGTSTLTGRTGSSGNVGAVKVSTDYCGSISLAADSNGLINFGTSSGTDCTTPGVGGAGNTHSARTQYWNQTMLKIKAYTYIPGNTWLQACQNTEVNYNSSCNAYWTGGATGFSRFFRSSSLCGNTGELPGVSLHEFGHGFDYNDGNGFSPDGGTGEVYGDTTAMLQTRSSCMGGGFWLAYNSNYNCNTSPSSGGVGKNCGGYGNCCTDCSGVRDVDYAKHVQSTTPATLTFAKACPTSTCTGPCGRECHCESYVGTESNWDLVNRDLVTWGMDVSSAWQLFDKLWYASAPNRLAAYVCTTNASTGTGNLFNQYRLIDDCDGDPSNGTPHASAIWNALSRHQIGNSSANNTDNNCGCASLSKPNLNGSAGNGSVTLTWSAISGASSYDIFRNETSCNAGFTKVGNTTSTSFTDTPLVNGVTYYYTIQAKGTGSCPPSPVSNCVTL